MKIMWKGSSHGLIKVLSQLLLKILCKATHTKKNPVKYPESQPRFTLSTYWTQAQRITNTSTCSMYKPASIPNCACGNNQMQTGVTLWGHLIILSTYRAPLAGTSLRVCKRFPTNFSSLLHHPYIYCNKRLYCNGDSFLLQTEYNDYEL